MQSTLSNNAAIPVVMQVLPSLRSGGVERGTVDVAKALVDVGYKSLVVSSGGAMVSQLSSVGAEHITLPMHKKSWWGIRGNVGRLIQSIRQHKVDILHARSRAPAWSCYHASRRLGVPFVTTFHGTYGLWGFGKKFYNSVMTKGDRVIAVSEFIADHIREHYSVDEERLRVVPRGVDFSYFNPGAVSTSRILEMVSHLQLPDGVPIILLPGRITEWKGQKYLVEALARLSHKDFYCLLVGEDVRKGKYRRELQQSIADLGLQSHVRIVSQVHDMAALYMLSDIVVSASTEPEAFGRVAVEGQAMGRLLVATAHGGACETVVDRKTGWLVEPGNVEAMADTLDKLLSLGREEREQYAANARKHVRARFSLEEMCKSVIGVYKELL